MYCANPAHYRASIRGLCRHLGENLFTRRSLDLRRGLKSIVLCFGTLIIILCSVPLRNDEKQNSTVTFVAYRDRPSIIQRANYRRLGYSVCGVTAEPLEIALLREIDQSWKRALVTELCFSVLANVAIKMNNIFQSKLKAVDEVDSEQF